MAMIRILLDTNAYSAFKRGDARIVDSIARADEILISVPVLGELRVGFKAGTMEKRNLDELEAFLSARRVSVPAITEQTALFYAEIYSGLKRQGTPLPINDVWIAACTVESGAVLISDDAHFKRIPGLFINTL
jgi:tRNA(fMet)-specific endonuclease VapC